MVCLSRLGLLPFIAVSKLWDEFVASVERFTINPSPPLAFLTISPLKGVLGLCDLPGKGFVGVLGRWEWVGVSCGVYWRGGLGLKQWGEDWAFKVFTVFIDILLGFPGPSDGLRLHPIVFFSSGSGLTADSSVLTLTL
ncbi:hypothetical protein Tco_1447621, partial [Tanacetum coccineum]